MLKAGRKTNAAGALLALMATSFLVSPAMAAQALQTQSDDGASTVPVGSGESQDAPNADIIVTAQRRGERLQDVPISIQALSAADIESKSLAQVSQLPLSVPSLRINYAGVNIQPSIRGVGSIVAGPGFYSNIPVYIDGYYVPSPGASDFDLISVESVNVLKGPQGTLFGFNATGGAIQINTRRPQQKTTSIIKLGYGSYDRITSAAYVSTGITSNLAVDASLSYERGDSYQRNIATGDPHPGRFKRYQFRSQILWEPVDSVEFLLSYAHRYEDNPRAVLNNVRDRGTIGIRVPDNIIATERGDFSGTGPAFFKVSSDSITLTTKIDLGFADLTSYTGRREDHVRIGLDYDTTPSNIYAAISDIPDRTFTQEFNLTSKSGGRLSWVLGAFYMNATNIYHFDTNTPSAGDGYGAPFNRLFDSRNNLKSYAAFADATYEAVDGLFLTLGGRYSIDEPSLSYNLIPANRQDAGDTRFRKFSPRAVARYQFSPQSSVYASYTQGYKAGTLPGSSFSLVPVRPEKIDAWEVGYKLADGPLRVNVAGFYYDYRDIQVTAFGENGASLTRNAAKAEIYGIDGDLTFKITPDLSIDLSGAYTHADYKDFPNAIGLQQVLDPNSANFGRFVNINVNATGFPVARTPRFAGTAGVTYGLDVAGGRLNLNGSVFHTSSFNFDAAAQLPQRGYEIVNLRATWTNQEQNLDLAAFVTNLTDTKYRASNLLDSYSSRGIWGDPRMVGGTITYRY